LRENYPEVQIMELAGNFGFCRPNNLAIAQSRSKYAFLLNNDTELDPGCLLALVETMDADPQLGVCDAKQLLFDQRDVVFSVGSDYTIAGSNMTPFSLSTDRGFDGNRDCFIGMAACILYRRTMLDEIGLFDEDFFAGREDVDLSFRAHLAGYRVQNVGRARCYHKVSATRAINSPDFVRRGQRNLHWVYLKNMPDSLLRRYWVHHLLYTLVTAVYFLRIKRGRAWLQAKLDVSRSIPEVLQKRREVQALKLVSDQEIDDLLQKHWISATSHKEKMVSALGIG
jgi:GT2 family glycosyltransferase